MKAGLCLCLLASYLAPICLAQEGHLEGELYAEKPTDFTHLAVRLETSGAASAERSLVSPDGGFRFSNLAQGNYTLVVIDEVGNEIAREPVNFVMSNPHVRFELPTGPAAARPGGVVSVSQLRRPPNPRAVRLAMKAGKLSDAGDYHAAAAQLEKAIALDPQFAAAYGNLGAQYIRLGEAARAAEEFRRAIALDPASAVQQANLALALAQVGQTAEAVQWARQALRIDSTNAVGHYVLGCIMLGDANYRAEAIRHLELASRDLPVAARALEAAKR